VYSADSWGKFQRAFTLIELLAVVFVVGLIVSLVVVNIERDDDQIAHMEARRFAALLRQLQDESILQGFVMGVTVDPVKNVYHFMIQKEKWQAVTEDEIMRERKLPGSVKLKLVILESTSSANADLRNDGSKLELEEPEEKEDYVVFPEIIVEPTGLTSPFILTFAGNSSGYEVRLDQDHDIVVSKAK